MQLRKLGRSTLEIFPLSLGTNVLGRAIDEPTAFAVLDAYMEGGGNCIDTADSYSAGESERVLGRWMKARGNRDRVIIATKLGSQMAPGKQGLSRRYMFEEVEASLQRLQTEYIDLYQAHQDDTETPLEETLQAFDELVRQGKVRVIGASNYSAARLAEALQVSQQHGYVRYESLQPLYNLLYMNERGFRILAEVERVASRSHATPAQVALAWIMARPGVTAPIASATSVEQVVELLGAVELQLDAEAITALNTASEWQHS